MSVAAVRRGPVEAGLTAAAVPAAVSLTTQLGLAAAAAEGSGAALVGALLLLLCEVGLAVILAAQARSPGPILLMAGFASVSNLFLLGVLLGASEDATAVGVFLCTESKTLLLLLAGLVVLFPPGGRREVPRAVVRACVALAAIAVAQMLQGDATAFARLGNLRNFIAPAAALLLIAHYWHRSQAGNPGAAAALRVIAPVFVLASFVEVVVGNAAWEALVSIEALVETKGLSGRTTDFAGFSLPRFGSVMIDPVNASYSLAAMTVYFLVRRRAVAAGLFGVLTLLTFGKGGLLLLIVPIGLLTSQFVLRRRFRRVSPTVMLVGIGAALSAYLAYVGDSIVAVVVSSATYVGGGSSASIHVAGLVNGLRAGVRNPLGHGTGTGGNFLEISGGLEERADWLQTGAESGLGTMAYQLGGVGVLAFGVAVIGVLRAIRRAEAVESRSRNLITCMLIGWVGGVSLQENALGPQALVVMTLVACACSPSGGASRSSRHDSVPASLTYAERGVALPRTP